MSKPTNALMIAGGSTLDTEDFELILRALDVLDRDMQTELANKGQDAAAGETRSRCAIVRTKLGELAATPVAEDSTSIAERVEAVRVELFDSFAIVDVASHAVSPDKDWPLRHTLEMVGRQIDAACSTLEMIGMDASKAQGVSHG